MRALFVDRYDTLSDGRFWDLIRSDAEHPFHDALQQVDHRLFFEEYGLTHLVPKMADEATVRDYFLTLQRRSLNPVLLNLLAAHHTHYKLVIATDNGNAFADKIRPLLRTPGHPLSIFDDLICSSDVGCLKKDSASQFFGHWLDGHGMGIEDALLVDDSEANIREFARAGGKTWDYDPGTLSELETTLKDFGKKWGEKERKLLKN